MAGVEHRRVARAEPEQRLDRWFKTHYPALRHSQLEKLLRTGQIRVDGKRAKASTRVEPGNEIRLPPQVTADAGDDAPKRAPARAKGPSDRDARLLREAVLAEDAHFIAINKPPGLAVQGGSGTTRHVDGMLDALKGPGDAERPRLVHRLDRDTSGLLILARTRKAATFFGKAFAGRDVHKLYWAVTVGAPKPAAGTIDAALSKQGAPGHERMAHDADGKDEDARRAVTLFRTVSSAPPHAAWLELMPETGRTHQLRAHCALIGTPIQGDRKYGGSDAIMAAEEVSDAVHLHARTLRFPHPNGGMRELTAPLPQHMARTFAYFGFEPGEAGPPFAFFDEGR